MEFLAESFRLAGFVDEFEFSSVSFQGDRAIEFSTSFLYLVRFVRKSSIGANIAGMTTRKSEDLAEAGPCNENNCAGGKEHSAKNPLKPEMMRINYGVVNRADTPEREQRS
jgi:hypothetical protein